MADTADRIIDLHAHGQTNRANEFQARDGVTTALELESRVPDVAASREIDLATWTVLTTSLYPGASPPSVVAVWDYCRARRLDVFRKPVHLVPMPVTTF